VAYCGLIRLADPVERREFAAPIRATDGACPAHQARKRNADEARRTK
jgi:hypothetical protein